MSYKDLLKHILQTITKIKFEKDYFLSPVTPGTLDLLPWELQRETMIRPIRYDRCQKIITIYFVCFFLIWGMLVDIASFVQ